MYWRQDWLFWKIATNKQNENKTPLRLLIQRSKQFFEQETRDAKGPQRPIPSAFLHHLQLWLFLPPLECVGNEWFTPIHSQKSWKRAIFPPLFLSASSCSFPHPFPSQSPSPTPSAVLRPQQVRSLGLCYACCLNIVTVVLCFISNAEHTQSPKCNSLCSYTSSLITWCYCFLVILMLLCFIFFLRTLYYFLITTN